MKRWKSLTAALCAAVLLCGFSVPAYGSSNMAQIANEILGLSRMNWNSFNLYSKLPCTIESSNQIAQIGWMLSQFEGSLYDYRFFM